MPIIKIIFVATVVILGLINLHDMKRFDDIEEIADDKILESETR